jgi:hypothetical protein
MPERSAGSVPGMVQEERGVRVVRRMLSPRLAIALGALAFALNVAELILVSSANESAPDLVRTMALVPTVAVGTLVAVRRPRNPIGRLMLSAAACFAVTGAAATLAAAALFNPLRQRVQRVVDRRFNRAHYDAEATVAGFAGRLRESVGLGSIQHELAAAVDQAFEPPHASVWLAPRASR